MSSPRNGTAWTDLRPASCLCGGDRSAGSREANESHFFLRRLERLQLGTPYPQVADRVAEINGPGEGDQLP